MLQRDVVDFTAGLTLGALVGAGLALALQRTHPGDGVLAPLLEALRDGLPVAGG